MEIQITSTDQLVEIDGVECRLWEGITSSGVPCVVMVHRIAARDVESTEFERELQVVAKADRFHAELVENRDPQSIVTAYVDSMAGDATDG